MIIKSLSKQYSDKSKRNTDTKSDTSKTVFDITEGFILNPEFFTQDLDEIAESIQYDFVIERRSFLANSFAAKFRYSITNILNGILWNTNNIASKFNTPLYLSVDELYSNIINDKWEDVRYYMAPNDAIRYSILSNVYENIIPNMMVGLFSIIHQNLMRYSSDPVTANNIVNEIYSIYSSMYTNFYSLFYTLVDDANNIYKEAGFTNKDLAKNNKVICDNTKYLNGSKEVPLGTVLVTRF